MPLPEPPVPLENICSVIYNNTLYTYSAGAFQALPLAEGAKWATLGEGESVWGGVCVGSTPKDPDQAGLYIVGGKAAKPDYPGLQKFTYSTGKWETIIPTVRVTQSRTWHGATYINSTDQILVYAGNQDGSKQLSSQTFTIQASAPYEVLAFESIAPPAISPILLPWSDTHAAMVGGDPGNTKVMLFNTVAGWADSGASLAEPLAKDVTAMRAVLMRGDDGCKNLYTFDMTQAPNVVKRVVLVNSAGEPVVKSAPITARSEDSWVSSQSSASKVEQRDLTLEQWPSYNNTLAPMSTRTNFAVAEDPNGLVVFSGGNKEDVLCMFDARQNSWQNATSKLAEQKLLISSEPSETTLASTTQSTSSTASASTTTNPAAAAASGGSGVNTNAILGIVLGTITLVMILIGLALFLIRRHKRRKQHIEAGHMRRASGAPSDEKDNIGFAKDSLAFVPEGHFRGHQNQDSQGSYSSMAILMGRVNQQKTGVSRKPSNDTKRSSSSSIFNKQFKSTISKPMPRLGDHPALQSQPQPQPKDDKAIAFAANTTQPRAMPRGSALARQGSTRRSSGWNRYWSGGSALNLLGFGASKRTTVDSDQSSQYSNMNRITQDSATVPPLNLEARPEISRVISGSPTVAQYSSKIPLKEGLSGKIERPVSQASSGYSSGIPESVREAWDPVSAQKPWGADRAPNNAYTGTFYNAPGLAPAPVALSKQPPLQPAATSTDMSWLNLGDFSKKPPGRA